MIDVRIGIAVVKRFGVHEPIHPSGQYGYERVEDLIAVYQGRLKGAYNYARQGTPTTAALEAKLTRLEDGVGTVCFATGMAAVSAVLLTLLRAGDPLVASRHLFGNTTSLLGTLEGLGVAETRRPGPPWASPTGWCGCRSAWKASATCWPTSVRHCGRPDQLGIGPGARPKRALGAACGGDSHGVVRGR